MTRAELRTRVLRAVNDSPTTPVYWQPAEIDATLQEGLELMAEEVPCLTRTFRVPRRPGTFLYHLEGLGEGIQTPYRLYLPDLHRRLEAWSLTDLDARHEHWMTVVGDPWVWAPVDWQQFVIWPVPTSGGGWLEIDCYVWPEAMTRDTDRPAFRLADHEALVYWAQAEGYLKQRLAPQAVDMEQQFLQRRGAATSRNGLQQALAGFHVRERQTGETP